MVTRIFGLSVVVFCAAFQVGAFPIGAFGSPSVATAKAKRIIFTPPVYGAKTIQVTEVMFEAELSQAGRGIVYGPLLQTGTVTIHLQLPNNPTSGDWLTRVDWKESNLSKHGGYCIETGKASAYFADGKFRPFPNVGGLWHDPLEELIVGINDHREEAWRQAVATIPAVRDGKIVLLNVDNSGNDPRDKRGLLPKLESEDWYDQKTHLVTRRITFSTWHGKKEEIMRTEYSGWVLNAPLPASLFAIPPDAVQEK